VTEAQLERAIVYPFADADGQIGAFCAAFAALRNDFDSRVSLSTALALSRTAASIDMMGTSPCICISVAVVWFSDDFHQYVIKC
jgi:hypothetical protein